jgi:ABC-type polysaccharide/polyol phosphate transport system ATPase subunit
MPNDAIIDVQSVSKKFCRNLRQSLWYALHDIGREWMGRAAVFNGLRKEEFWALQDVSIRIVSGEALGLLGKNGSGKTTLLKVLSGILKPDRGCIKSRGRVATLIGLGTGFAPMLTGRENIYVNGAILGLPKAGVDQIVDQIIDFAEIEDFIEMPVQNYSEGMKARLGFAVAAYLNPDVMLVDEALAVGDFGFQRKCLNRISDYLDRGGALILVSHNMHLVQSICSRALVLNAGQTMFDGSTSEAISCYSILNGPSDLEANAWNECKLNDSNPVVIKRLELLPVDSGEVRTGGAINVILHYHSLKDMDPVTWGFSFWTHNQEVRITTCVAKYAGKLNRLCKGEGELSCIIPKLPLVPRLYRLKGGIYDVRTGWPIARSGEEGPAYPFVVNGYGNEAESRHVIDGDIIDLDVDWKY